MREDIHNTEHGRMLRTVVMGIWPITVVALVSIAVLQPQMMGRVVFAFSGMTTLCIVALTMRRLGRVRLGGAVLVSGLIVQLGVQAIGAGGIRAPGITGYLAIVLLSGILLGDRAGVIAGVACVLIGLALVVAEMRGMIRPLVPYSAVTLWLLSCIYIGIIIILQRMAARTISNALRRAEGELQERIRTDEERERLVHALGERVKELQLLHYTARLLQAPGQFGQETLRQLVNEIPHAWQYPEVCEARITYRDDVASTAGWRDDTPWQQTAEYNTSAGKGHICVGYTEARPEEDEGPFLAEERALLESLAEMFVAHIEGTIAREGQRTLEHQLRQSQKMQALGTLAGGIAHDFNNILTAVQGNLDLTRLAPSDSELRTQSLKEIAKATNRAKDLVQRILLFSRQHEAERKVVDVAPLVAETVELLRASIPSRVTIEIQVAPNLPFAIADASQLHQVIMNLGTNAVHALTTNGGVVKISIEQIATEEADGPPDLQAGLYLCITIRDNGTGIDANIVDRIFEPFFTTKGLAGTGLGLSMVYGIVRDHGGAITVESAIGRGTTFRVYLPAIQSADSGENAALPTSRELMHGAGERVMYVDDEDSIVFVTTRLLDQLGYDVIGYTDAHKALAAFCAASDSFDAVITDYNMPAMTGLDLARAMKQIRADVPIALMSAAAAAPVDANFVAVINKPVRIEELIGVLQDMLAERS
jgi:signal transduction histidine kinase/CheY-like chemotaxis protein